MSNVEGHRELPRDPYDALTLENDVLGVRLWGPATQPTLSIGKSDIWDRRWFADKQPLITLAHIRECAMTDRLSEIAPSQNRTAYDVYGKYDFPCPKPGAQIILGTPFATRVLVEPNTDGSFMLLVEGEQKRLRAKVWVALARTLVVIEIRAEGLQPDDLRIRIYRHRDTIVPGQPVDPTLGGHDSPGDFEQLPAPTCCRVGDKWGIRQDFTSDPTFPHGFRFVTMAAVMGADPKIECEEGKVGLGTPLWAPQEGRLGHGVVKRYDPINQAAGAGATARFDALPGSFTVVATLMTTQDGRDPEQTAFQTLDDVLKLGGAGLRREQARVARRAQRKDAARARIGGNITIAVPSVILPKLRHAHGYYGDVPLCSVGSTKFCFQDAGLWHSDFHLNEIRAESMLTLGQFEELLPYCEMIHTLLPQAQENARDVYDLPGAMYPLVHFPLHCQGIAHTNLTWEQDMGLNGLVSKPLWLYYRYTGDKALLKEMAYPVLRACARFSAAYLSKGEDGYMHIVPTVSPEHWGLTVDFERNRDGTSALTLTRYLLLAAARAAQALDTDPREALAWRTTANKLAPYPTYTTENGPVWVDVAGVSPIEYNIPVPLSPLFWGDHVGLDSDPETVALAMRTLDQIEVWKPHRGYLDTCIRPRLGICAGPVIRPENLLLSYQSIRIFPAVPPDVEIVMEDFAAEGGFRVSAVRTAQNEICDVRLRSLLGGTCRVANPWPGQGVVALDADGGEVTRLDAGQSHVTFDACAGARYELRAF